jgi:hypothetical protein
MEISALNRRDLPIFVPSIEALPALSPIETLSVIDQFASHVSTKPKNS